MGDTTCDIFLFTVLRLKNYAFLAFTHSVSKSIDLLYYTQYGQDSTVTGGEDSEIKHDLANPFTGMATIMALSRKNIPNALMNQIGQIYRALTSLDQLTVASYYYDLYKLYMGAYIRSEEKKNPKAMALQTLNQGPPKPPSMFENLFNVEADKSNETKKEGQTNDEVETLRRTGRRKSQLQSLIDGDTERNFKKKTSEA